MLHNEEIIEKIKAGSVGVIPTDTVYGLVCSAFNSEATDMVYTIKKRDPKKPLVYLIGKVSDLEKFGIILDEEMEQKLQEYWPGPVSIVFECDTTPEYIHRGGGSVAIRLPADSDLRNLLDQAGPLASTSANPEGESPAVTIAEAKEYFQGNPRVVFYVDGGELKSNPSKIIKLQDSKIDVIRE